MSCGKLIVNHCATRMPLPLFVPIIASLAIFLTAILGAPVLALNTDDVRDLPVTEDDLRILTRTVEMLQQDTAWNRKDDRQCADDERQGKWSLYCALNKASTEVLGKYRHRRAAIQQVRLAIKETTPGREYQHRLADYNNDALTTLPDVKRVLNIALERVRHELYGD